MTFFAKRPFKRWLGLGLTVIASCFFLAYAVKHREALSDLPWSPQLIGTVAVLTVLYVLPLTLIGWAWHLFLRATGDALGVRQALIVFFLSQFAKYVPGNVAHLLSRVGLARHYGCKPAHALVALALEIGCIIVSALTLSIVALLEPDSQRLFAERTLGDMLRISGLIVAVVGVPMMLIWALRRWRPNRLQKWIPAELAVPRLHVFVGSFILYALYFVSMGGVLCLLVRELAPDSAVRYFLLTGVFSFTWVLGYIVPGSPGGLGVRESAMLAALGPIYGSGTALGLAILLRVVTFLGDGFGFALALLASRSLALNPTSNEMNSTD